MELSVWISMIILFLAGGLTPGPAVMLIIASSLRYGFARALVGAIGICVANVVWISLAASGAGVLAEQFPNIFFALKIGGLIFICWLAWNVATQPVDIHFEDDVTDVLDKDGRKSGRAGQMTGLFFRGVGLQLANPNALVFFGGLLPAFFNTSSDVIPQALVMIATVTFTELVGLVFYAAGARALAHLFSHPKFARIFYIGAALLMVGSVLWAVVAQLFAG